MSAKGFRINSKSIFLTYPQCHTSLEEFTRRINQFFGANLEKGIACQEIHQDGNPHLHAALILKKPYQTTKSDALDVLTSPPSHGNYCGRFKGGPKAAFKYVSKEGQYRLLPEDDSFDLKEFLKKSKKDRISDQIVSSLQSGASMDDLDDQFPSFLLLHHSQVQRYVDFRNLKSKRRAFQARSLLPVRVRPASNSAQLCVSQISAWINKNVRQVRHHRQKQLWIQGPPGCGKTSLIMFLEKTFDLQVYWWPKDEKWMDSYSDGCYDLIVLDEFRAQKMITELNPILSGDPVPVSRRCCEPLVKRDNLPVIILSNFDPETCYHKCMPSQLAPLLDRLDIIHVPANCQLRFEPVPDLDDDPTPVTLEDPADEAPQPAPTEPGPSLDSSWEQVREEPLPWSPWSLTTGIDWDRVNRVTEDYYH